MALTNAEAMREIMLRAVDGTEAGVQAAAALIADDVRIWQQGAGWMTRTAKMESWRRGLGAPLGLGLQVLTLLLAGEPPEQLRIGHPLLHSRHAAHDAVLIRPDEHRDWRELPGAELLGDVAAHHPERHLVEPARDGVPLDAVLRHEAQAELTQAVGPGGLSPEGKVGSKVLLPALPAAVRTGNGVDELADPSRIRATEADRELRVGGAPGEPFPGLDLHKGELRVVRIAEEGLHL